jgi:hypothetical protein
MHGTTLGHTFNSMLALGTYILCIPLYTVYTLTYPIYPICYIVYFNSNLVLGMYILYTTEVLLCMCMYHTTVDHTLLLQFSSL